MPGFFIKLRNKLRLFTNFLIFHSQYFLRYSRCCSKVFDNFVSPSGVCKKNKKSCSAGFNEAFIAISPGLEI